MAEILTRATGRRKTSVARAQIRVGSGKIIVNNKNAEEYFTNQAHFFMVRQPLEVTDSADKYDIYINVKGGGLSGQAGACRHALARSLAKYDPDSAPSLKANGFLTRDPRMVERKKYGKRGARRSFQFSKR